MLTTLGTPHIQNFDTLPSSGSATWTNNSAIPGWFHARTGTGTTITSLDVAYTGEQWRNSASTSDPNPDNQTASATTTVSSASNVSATKTIAGAFSPVGNVTYTIVLTNTASTAQADNPGDEFVDVLPASLVNQGTVFFDADGNGTNESSALTDDPTVAGSANATAFFMVSNVVTAIPALDALRLLAVALLLAVAGAFFLRERGGG